MSTHLTSASASVPKLEVLEINPPQHSQVANRRKGSTSSSRIYPRIGPDDLGYLDSFPAGYRFCPSDEELVIHYLEKKVHDQKLPPCKILDVDIYKYNPEFLASAMIIIFFCFFFV